MKRTKMNNHLHHQHLHWLSYKTRNKTYKNNHDHLNLEEVGDKTKRKSTKKARIETKEGRKKKKTQE